jgi:hypothetical protein
MQSLRQGVTKLKTEKEALKVKSNMIIVASSKYSVPH